MVIMFKFWRNLNIIDVICWREIIITLITKNENDYGFSKLNKYELELWDFDKLKSLIIPKYLILK